MTDLFTWQDRVVAENNARLAREDGINRAEEHSPSEWRATALKALNHVARMQLTFTSHDVWRRLEELSVEKPHEESAMGAVFRQASKAGLIEKTGRYVPSQMVQCHRDIAEWKKS